MTDAWLPQDPDPALRPVAHGVPSPFGPPGSVPSRFGQAGSAPSRFGLPEDGQSQRYGQQRYGQQQYGQAQQEVRPALAHWGERVGASIIDALVMQLPMLACFAYTFATAAYGIDVYGKRTIDATSAGYVVLAVGYASALGLWLWNRVIRQGRTGRSIGKSALHLRLVGDFTGQPVGPGLAFGREFAHIVDGPLYLGYLWPLWDGKNQTFADKLAGTQVVHD